MLRILLGLSLAVASFATASAADSYNTNASDKVLGMSKADRPLRGYRTVRVYSAPVEQPAVVAERPMDRRSFSVEPQMSEAAPSVVRRSYSYEPNAVRVMPARRSSVPAMYLPKTLRP